MSHIISKRFNLFKLSGFIAFRDVLTVCRYSYYKRTNRRGLPSRIRSKQGKWFKLTGIVELIGVFEKTYLASLQNLLEVVHDLFEEQTSIDKVIMKIMQRAQRLLKCERAAVLLVDESCDSTRFSKLFDLNSPKHNIKNNVKK